MSCAAKYQYKRRRPEETLLYKVIADNIETFIAQRESECRPLPKYISEEFKSFLTCGLPQFGFWRLKCSKCDHEQILPFSCKKRGFCGSCGAKRAEETSFHLTDNVLTVTPYRQWVVTLPIPLRFWCIANKKLLAEVHKIIITVISDFYRKNIGEDQIAQTGSVSFTQYFGSNLVTNPHFHILFCDGVYTKPKGHPEAEPSFVHKLPPNDEEVGSVLPKHGRAFDVHTFLSSLIPSCGRCRRPLVISRYSEITANFTSEFPVLLARRAAAEEELSELRRLLLAKAFKEHTRPVLHWVVIYLAPG